MSALVDSRSTMLTSTSGRGLQSTCRPNHQRRTHRQTTCMALRPKEGLKVDWKQGSAEVMLRVPVPMDLRGAEVEWEVHPTRLRVAARGHVLLEGDFGNSKRVDLNGCFWSMETEGDDKFVEVTLGKVDEENWTQVIEADASDSSGTAGTEMTDHTFMDLEVDGESLGRVEFGLFGKVVPKTADNFLALCTGEKGLAPDGKPLHYKGSVFHRIIPGFMVQGGDYQNADGTGGESIFGGAFDDENFVLDHDQPLLLSMANAGPNTNGSQFFITLAETPWLDGKHTVFGKVTKGGDIVQKLAELGAADGKPCATVTVADCGEIDTAADMGGLQKPSGGDLDADMVAKLQQMLKNDNGEMVDMNDVKVTQNGGDGVGGKAGGTRTRGSGKGSGSRKGSKKSGSGSRKAGGSESSSEGVGS